MLSEQVNRMPDDEPEPLLPNNWAVDFDQSVYDLSTREQAQSLYELTLHGLKKLKREEDYTLSVRETADGKFDLIVLKRLN